MLFAPIGNADEGISGTSLAHRDEFNRMISDCRAGKIDIIITKSVSRFARNVVDCISIVRMLTELPHPVTIPSWAGSIERTRTMGNLNKVSSEAKIRLKEALGLLQRQIQSLIAAMKEEY